MAKKSIKHPDLATALRAAIANYPGTPYRLAQLAGVSQIQLSRYVEGERDLRFETVDKLAKVLGLALVRVADPVL